MKKTEKNDNIPLRRRVFDVIQIAGGNDPLSIFFDYFIISTIVVSIIITALQTFDMSTGAAKVLYCIDAFCMISFTIEYLLRLLTADYLYPKSSAPVIKYITSPSAIIDLLSFLPFYVSGLVPPGLVVFRLVRVVRILRLFHINRYSDPLTLITGVLKKKASQILASVFLVFMLMYASSILMYYAEHTAQPELFKNAFSGLWWAVSTLSTTGYGDIYPVTVLGKIIAIVITLLGMCVVAIPTGIITAGFIEAVGNTSSESASLFSGTGIIDISRELFSCPVYPGDPEPGITPVSSVAAGDECSLTRIVIGSHSGTHLDAPSHFIENGQTVEQLSLTRCTGRCIVCTAEDDITPEFISRMEIMASGEASNRILFKGGRRISPEAAEYMKDIGIVLTGTENSSIGDTLIHQTLLSNGVVILENLDLSNVEDGEYYLSAAPIKMEGLDGAPVRAYLVKTSQ
ncbi:MAG: ion transporter [Lachnospiraceae bacterium]|nr:ion transporter [Lachnospiraceae bacterium]